MVLLPCFSGGCCNGLGVDFPSPPFASPGPILCFYVFALFRSARPGGRQPFGHPFAPHCLISHTGSAGSGCGVGCSQQRQQLRDKTTALDCSNLLQPLLCKRCYRTQGIISLMFCASCSPLS